MEIIDNTFYLTISIYLIVSGILIWNSEKTFRREREHASILQNRENESSAQNDTVFLPERVFPCNPQIY